MARKRVPSKQGAVWTTKDIAAIRRLVKSGAAGQTIAEEIGRSIFALYQKASIEGISGSPENQRVAAMQPFVISGAVTDSWHRFVPRLARRRFDRGVSAR